MLLNKKLDDPLLEFGQPSFAQALKITHHSVTSLHYPDGIYAYRYIFCDQTDRRNFESNSNMMGGVAVGDALSYRYANVIWKMNPLTKKLAPVENPITTEAEAIDRAMIKFRKYIPVDQTDHDKFDHYLETVPQTIKQGFKILNELCINRHVICEDVINHQDKRISLPLIGRSDFSVQDLTKEKSLAGVHHSTKTSPKDDLLSILELKTSWQKPMKRKKSGERSFSYARLPDLPNPQHLQQIAFYATAKAPVDAKLIYLTADGFKVFDKDNCVDLKPENLKNYYEEIIRLAIRRERLLRRYEHLNDPDKMKLEILRDCSPDFDHRFYWKIGNHYLNRAKELWQSI